MSMGDDTKDQIPLFDLQQPEKKPVEKQMLPDGKVIERAIPTRKSATKKESAKFVPQRMAKVEISRPAKMGKSAKVAPGPVPEGDVRLTANIRQDLHLKLKVTAAHRRTTIGELIEGLVETYL